MLRDRRSGHVEMCRDLARVELAVTNEPEDLAAAARCHRFQRSLRGAPAPPFASPRGSSPPRVAFLLPSFLAPAAPRPRLLVCQAFLFGALERRLLDEEALPLVALSRAAEAHDHGG